MSICKRTSFSIVRKKDLYSFTYTNRICIRDVCGLYQNSGEKNKNNIMALRPSLPTELLK